VARDKAVLDLWWADMDALHVLDLVTPVVTSTARFTHLIMVAKTGDQFALEFAARMRLDGVKNGLVGYRFLRNVKPKIFSLNYIFCSDRSDLMSMVTQPDGF